MIQIIKNVSILVAVAVATLIVGAQAATAMPSPARNFAAASCTSGQINGTFDDNVCCPAGSQGNGTACFFAKYVNPVIALLSAVVGIVVVISLIVAGIQYSSAQGDPGKIQAAKQRITNSLIALFAFFFLFAALNWLVPGGLL